MKEIVHEYENLWKQSRLKKSLWETFTAKEKGLLIIAAPVFMISAIYILCARNTVLNVYFGCFIVTGKKAAMIFEREADSISLGYTINKKSLNTSINPKMPYLSFLAINYDIPVISEVITWFESCIIRSYANPVVEHQILLAKDAPYKEQFIRALNDMDIDITGYRYDEDTKQLFMQRTLSSQEYELPFSQESDGTKKLIAALPVILLALREGRMVIIDELDAKLHPKLLRYVISLFKNKEINKYGAQLLFTSHDMCTLKNTIFRRDEIWFAAENASHESEIYSLHEIRGEDNDRVKNTAAYDKQYLEGRYGADPSFRLFGLFPFRYS